MMVVSVILVEITSVLISCFCFEICFLLIISINYMSIISMNYMSIISFFFIKKEKKTFKRGSHLLFLFFHLSFMFQTEESCFFPILFPSPAFFPSRFLLNQTECKRWVSKASASYMYWDCQTQLGIEIVKHNWTYLTN